MNISIIVAHSEKGNVIGKDGNIPWKIPSDLKNFSKITSGETVIMGRKTYESIPDKYRPLPNRRTIVLTTNNEWEDNGVDVAHNVQEAINLLDETEEAYVIGGEEIYRVFLPFSKLLYVSYVEVETDGDAFFPSIDKSNYKELFSHRFNINKDEYPYTLKVLESVNFSFNFDINDLKNRLNIV
jgi:dihydrofolate reductase